MEEKKRRPRISKTESDLPLEERPKAYLPEENNEHPEEKGFEKKPLSDQPPRDENRPFNPDRPRYDRNDGGGGYNRRPYDNDRPRYDRNDGGSGGGYRRPYDNDRPRYDRNDGGGSGGGTQRPYDNDRPRYDRNDGGSGGGYNKRPYDNDRPRYDRNDGGSSGGYNRRPYDNDRPRYDRNDGAQRPYDNDRPRYDRNDGGSGGGYNKRPYDNDRPRYDRNDGGGGYNKPYGDRQGGGGGGYNKPYGDRQGGGGGYNKPYGDRQGGGGYGKKPFGKKPFNKRKDDFFVERKPKPGLPSGEGMPLNKYLAHCGISSRRKAVEYIEQGQVTVNGEVKMEPYYRIQAGDVVTCEGKALKVQERQVYVLLNKPKNVITTTEDERNRPTVLDIVDPFYPERLYPVGRLDRETTGLILLTNDGDLAQKLAHPSHNVQKQYRVGIRRPLTQADFERIEQGVELEDGLAEVNWIRFSQEHPDRDVVELEISSGRNRIVRRIFESLGYEVHKLDRFYFAGLTKKDLPRGSFRDLTQREIVMLKHFTGHPGTAKKKTKDLENTSDEEFEAEMEAELDTNADVELDTEAENEKD